MALLVCRTGERLVGYPACKNLLKSVVSKCDGSLVAESLSASSSLRTLSGTAAIGLYLHMASSKAVDSNWGLITRLTACLLNAECISVHFRCHTPLFSGVRSGRSRGRVQNWLLRPVSAHPQSLLSHQERSKYLRSMQEALEVSRAGYEAMKHLEEH